MLCLVCLYISLSWVEHVLFCCRMNRTSLWNKFFSCLLNTAQPLPLSDMANEMRRTKLEGLKDYVFQAFFKKVFAAVQKKIGQTS